MMKTSVFWRDKPHSVKGGEVRQALASLSTEGKRKGNISCVLYMLVQCYEQKPVPGTASPGHPTLLYPLGRRDGVDRVDARVLRVTCCCEHPLQLLIASCFL